MMSFLFFGACKTPKESNSPVDEVKTGENTQVENRNRLTGKVMLSNECPLFIEAYESNTRVIMYPVNLDPQFQKSGMKISFYYQPSRAKQPSGCVVDKVVSVEDVQLIKN